ncbi:MAG: hypothetical protein Q9175_008003, partial [Cornicularia normoerica]
VSKAANDLCLPNTKTDAPSSRQLVTGVHTVSDVRCAFCSSMLGWKYDGAEEESQRYKVGKYILETKMIYSSSNWEIDELELPPTALRHGGIDASSQDAFDFDSQDEDERVESILGGKKKARQVIRKANGWALNRDRLEAVLTVTMDDDDC